MTFVLGTIFGIFIMVGLLTILGLKETKKGRDMLKKIDKLVDDNGLKFHSRVKNIVYLNGFEKYTIIYLTDVNKIAVMEGMTVVLNHNVSIGKNTSISNKISQKFNKEINNTTVIGGITYSKNIVGGHSKSETVKPKETFFSTDDILEQITEKGIDSLSTEQKEWLDNLSKN